MKVALILLLAFLPELAFSQPPAQVTRLVRVHYADARILAHLATNGTSVNANADHTLKAIVLHGEPAAVASVEQLIHELDVPSTAPTSKDIEVVVSVIGASSSADAPAASEMPPDMMPVVKQLRAIFPYKNYQVLSSMLVRSREGSKAQSKGIMKGLGSSSRPSDYYLAYEDASIAPEGVKPVIHLRNFNFNTKVPVPTGPADTKATAYATTQFQISDVGIATDVDLREGQKTVVGKADIGSSDSALFVVLTARLVD